MPYHSLENVVEDKFDQVFNEAKQKAETDFNTDYLNNTQSLSHFEKFKFILQKEELVERTLEMVNPFYSEEPDNYDSLLKRFATRVVLLNYDESNDLFTGIYTGFIRKKLFHLKQELIKEIPKYSFQEFIDGKYDPYYLELEYLYHLTEEDYYKIKEWQSYKLLEIVGLESQILIGKLQEKLQGEMHPEKLLLSQKEIFDNKIHRQEYDEVTGLIQEMKKFVFLENCNFEKLNNSETLTDLKQFNSDKIFWGKIHPANIENVRKLYLKNKNAAFTPSYLLFFSINKVIVWIEEALKSDNYFEPFVYPDLHKVFSSSMEKAELEAEKKIEKLEEGLTRKNKADRKQFVFHVLEKLRYEVNQRDFFRYYYQMLDNEIVLENLFVTNAFLDNDVEAHINHLIKAYSLKESIYHFWFLWEEITGKMQIRLDDNYSTSFMEVIHLSNSMPFDAELKRRIGNVLHQTFEDFETMHLPMDFIHRNTEEQMKDIFFDSIENLSTYLETSPYMNKLAYVYSKIKELKQRELELKRYDNEPDFKDGGTYTRLFKDCLEIQSDYIEKTKDIGFVSILNALNSQKVKELPEPKEFSFGLKPYPKPIISLIKQLCLKTDFLKSPTTPEDLEEVLTSNNILNCNKEIHFGCNTNQLSYIVEKLQPFFKDFNPTTIENSNLFYTKGGTLLKRQNLYSNSGLSQPKKAKIDNIFKQFQ